MDGRCNWRVDFVASDSELSLSTFAGNASDMLHFGGTQDDVRLFLLDRFREMLEVEDSGITLEDTTVLNSGFATEIEEAKVADHIESQSESVSAFGLASLCSPFNQSPLIRQSNHSWLSRDSNDQSAIQPGCRPGPCCLRS